VSAALALAARLDADLIAGGVSDGGSFPNGSTSAALLRGARRAVLLAPQAADAPSPAHA
jgi:hypothetical protein